MSQTIGAVTEKRYRQLVSEGRDLIERASRCQFKSGDQSLEIEPLRPRGGPAPADRATVEESLGLFSAGPDVSLEKLAVCIDVRPAQPPRRPRDYTPR